MENVILSEMVCWSRMQTEAGQALNDIVSRKEIERQNNNGLFMWGVGNPPPKIISQLAKDKTHIDVVFSIMKGRPKQIDVNPTKIYKWTGFIDFNGLPQPIPSGSLVTSRGKPGGAPKDRHYALMCYSDKPIVLGDFGQFPHLAYRNVGGTGATVGNSQVTALLKYFSNTDENIFYKINILAKLTNSFWVKLINPVLL